MDILPLFAFLLIGILAGLVAGMLGLSGGIVTVPCLIFLFEAMGFPNAHFTHIAIGTSLAAMALTTTTSALTHHSLGSVVWSVVLAMLPGIFIGSLLGSLTSHNLSGVLLQILFGVFVILLGLFVLLKKHKLTSEAKKPQKVVFTWIGLCLGFVASMIGIGGGVFTVPLLLSYRFVEKKAIGTSAAVGMCITIFAAIAYLYFGRGTSLGPYQLGYIYWPALILIAIPSVFCARIGAKLANKMDPKHLRKIFAISLIGIGIIMVFN